MNLVLDASSHFVPINYLMTVVFSLLYRFCLFAGVWTREAIPQAEIPGIGGTCRSGQTAQDDRRPSQNLVSKQTHKVEVSFLFIFNCSAKRLEVHLASRLCEWWTERQPPDFIINERLIDVPLFPHLPFLFFPGSIVSTSCLIVTKKSRLEKEMVSLPPSLPCVRPFLETGGSDLHASSRLALWTYCEATNTALAPAVAAVWASSVAVADCDVRLARAPHPMNYSRPVGSFSSLLLLFLIASTCFAMTFCFVSFYHFPIEFSGERMIIASVIGCCFFFYLLKLLKELKKKATDFSIEWFILNHSVRAQEISPSFFPLPFFCFMLKLVICLGSGDDGRRRCDGAIPNQLENPPRMSPGFFSGFFFRSCPSSSFLVDTTGAS